MLGTFCEHFSLTKTFGSSHGHGELEADALSDRHD